MSSETYLLHLHRFEAETFVTESDKYLIFDNFDKCVGFGKDWIEKWLGIKFDSVDFKIENDKEYAEAFITTSIDGKYKEWNAEFGSKIYKRDNYTIKCLPVKNWDLPINSDLW